MKNILVIHQSAEMYGSDKMLYLTIESLDKNKFYPIIVLPEEGPLKDEFEKKGIEVVIAPVLKVYRSMFTPKNLLRFFKDIKKGIAILDLLNKKYNFDIVYSNTLAVLLGMVYARKRKIKHVWHVHEIITSPTLIANLFPVLLYRYADITVCNSHATEENLTKKLNKLSQKSIVIQNGLDAEIYPDPEPHRYSRETLGFSSSDIIITLLGRIGWFKGHKWLLSTYIEFLNSDNIKILFVGSPVPGQEHYQEELESMIRENHLEDKIKIIPFTKNLNSIWNITDIGIVPSTESEPFGLVAVEAMLRSKPVIASNHGGLKEIVVNNQTGYLVEPSNSKALADSIFKLAKNEQLRKDFGEKGYERAISQFSLKRYNDKIAHILEG